MNYIHSTAMGSGLGDAAEIPSWDKHMATGSPVPQLRSTEPQQPDYYLQGSGIGSFIIPPVVMLLGSVRGCWYQLSLSPCCGVKVGVAPHGCSPRGLA